MAISLAALRLGRTSLSTSLLPYTHSWNHSIITTFFQTYFLILSQINSKNYQFHTFFSQTYKVELNPHESYSVSLSGENKR